MNVDDAERGVVASPVISADLLVHRRRPAPLSRADRSPLARWYAEVDRVSLGLILSLMAIGLLAVAVASPVGVQSLERIAGGGVTYPPLYYFWRQIFWVATGIMILLAVATRSKAEIKRIAFWGLIIGVIALFAVLVVGTGAKGSVRGLGSGGFRVQPSEFLKPVFAVAVGWILSCKVEDDKLPVFALSFALTLLIVMLLMLQTDLGQSVLYLGTWIALAFVAGLSLRSIGLAAAGGLVGVGVAYLTYDTARRRIDSFLFGEGDTHQVDRGLDTLSNSGLIGSGPFSGTAKFRLPEAHTDFIFSVIGEEFGLIACAGILIVYVALVVRTIQRLREERDQFVILAGAGLILQFTAQVFINIAVNLQIAPTKGMTLPFISYGGSSLWALSLTMGLLLALTRRNPYRASHRNAPLWNPR